MPVRKRRNALVGAIVVVAAALFAQSAQASVTPSLSLDQSGGTQAGAYQNLGMDLKFTDSLSDSPDVLTIDLPPGLLANATVNGGACLKTTSLDDACQVGTGTVSADAIVDTSLPVALPVDVTFDLVAPPNPGDLAGLAVNMYGQQIGQTADIRVRPSGDPDGVGLTITLVLPNTLAGVPIEITEINSTFDALRYPASCPSTPARVNVSVNSYQGTSTVHNLSAPLSVTGCSALPYAPKLSVKATKDSSSRSVAIDTSVTQAANESPSRNLTLAFPGNTLGVNLQSVKLLCGNPATDHCTPVGQATAVSPLYPTPLTANAYLTGTPLGPTLTLVFPSPFPLTLVGTVTLTTKTAAFTGLPDIPLTSLALNLSGGASSLFLTNCNPGSGRANGTSSDQNGDRTVSASVSYDISGCPASSYSAASSGSRSGANAAPSVTSPALVGMKSGHPALSFRVSVRRHAAMLTRVSIGLSKGIGFIRHRVGRRLRITGVAVHGARVRSLAISHGRLVIRLRRPARAFRVRLTTVLHEDSALIAAVARRRTVRLHMSLIALNTRHRSHTIHRTLRLS